MSYLMMALILGYGLGAATWPFVLDLFRAVSKRISRSGRRRMRRYHY